MIKIFKNQNQIDQATLSRLNQTPGDCCLIDLTKNEVQIFESN